MDPFTEDYWHIYSPSELCEDSLYDRETTPGCELGRDAQRGIQVACVPFQCYFVLCCRWTLL